MATRSHSGNRQGLKAVSRSVLSLLLLSAVASPAVAEGLTVSPMRLELPPNGRPTVLQIQNPGSAPTLVRIQAIAWANIDEIDRTPVAPEILAVPPVVQLPPNGRQTIRVALRQPLTSATEQAYRLLVTEIPTETGEGTGLTFAVRMNLPVFVTPEGAAPAAVWSIREESDGVAELVLRNEGRAHLRLSSLTLRAPDDPAPLFTSTRGVYALPGDEHAWPLEKPFVALPDLLQVHAETQFGEIVTPLATPLK